MPDYSIGYVSKVEHQQIHPSDHFIQLASERLGVNKRLLVWTPKDGEAVILSLVQRIRREDQLTEEEKNTLFLLSYEKLSKNLLLSIFLILINVFRKSEPQEKTIALVHRSLDIFGSDEDRTFVHLDREELVEYFTLCGNCYFEKQDFYKADNLYTKAEAFLPDGSSLLAARVYYNLSLVKQRIRGYDDMAIRYADKALKIFKLHHAETEVYDVYIKKGVQLHLGGKYEESLQCLQHAEDYFEKRQDINKLQMIYYNKGRAYQGMEDHEKAIAYLNRALSLQDKAGNTIAKTYVYRVLGEIYIKENKLQLAERLINGGLYLAIQHQLTYLECEFRELKARLFWLKGNVKEYVKAIESVIHDASKYHYHQLASNFSYSYANTLYQKGKFKLAAEYYRNGFILMEKGGKIVEEEAAHSRCND